jgi:hypothetical protein
LVEAASQREQFGRVIDAMHDYRRVCDEHAKFLPQVGMLFEKERIQGNAQGHALLIEQPANPGNTATFAY